MPTDASKTTIPPWLGALLAIPFAVLALCLLDVLCAPTYVLLQRPTLAVWMAVLAVGSSTNHILIALLIQLALVGALFVRKAPWPLLAALGTTPALYAYWVISQYERFRGYLPLILAVAGIAGLLACAWGCFTRLGTPGARGLRRLATWTPAVGAAIAFAALSLVNYSQLREQYPTLHLGILVVSYALLHAAVAALLVSGFVPRRAILVLGVSAGLAFPAIITLSAVAGATAIATDARPYFYSGTILGRSDLHRGLFLPRPPPASSGLDLSQDPSPERTFRESSGLPALPPEMRLEDYNILLVTTEAVRYDQTSLADPALETTPNLVQWQRAGAWSFSRAYSPSSATSLSMASILSMTYPSATAFQTWPIAWHGELLPEAETVPEVLGEAGYGTFWVGHNYKENFDRSILGFDQGFDAVRLHAGDSPEDLYPMDRAIADGAMAEIDRVVASGQRFFGWVFFVSPHAPYLDRQDGKPSKTALDRYRGELRNADIELGRLLEHLEQRGLRDDTIVIFTADHGEEFGDHGGTLHGATLYSELTHVPLIVDVPGATGATVDAPVSSMYVLPWLLLTGTEDMRQAALVHVRDEISPVLRHTDGAVVLERIGHDKVIASLVYPDTKVNHYYPSELIEVYDLDVDPGETEDQFLLDPEGSEAWRDRVERYRRVRAATSRIVVTLP
jgi:arylsulfatase A-like enzyme